VPEWAAEFDARTWAQFFLKFVVSHPAVTAATPATSQPANMVDNLGGGIGRLPDEAMRRRMVELVDALPTA
jgi:aryl-alcohol dehydrogenase-like predicted oxidoreductase